MNPITQPASVPARINLGSPDGEQLVESINNDTNELIHHKHTTNKPQPITGEKGGGKTTATGMQMVNKIRE